MTDLGCKINNKTYDRRQSIKHLRIADRTQDNNFAEGEAVWALATEVKSLLTPTLLGTHFWVSIPEVWWGSFSLNTVHSILEMRQLEKKYILVVQG
jgi:hypothetical protein